MREEIGETAGKVWRTLGQKGEVNIAMLPKLLQEKNDMTYQALGWLAHENKIVYLKKNGKDFVALAPQEQEAFKTVH